MIKFLENKNIDKEKWDKCIDASLNRNIFVCSWYLDCVAPNCWDALVLNDYEAVFPLASGTKFRISYLYQPFFSRYFGVYSRQEITHELVRQFFNEIPERFKYIEFCLQEQNEINDKNWEVKEREFQVMELTASYGEASKNYNDNTRRSIKKALGSGCIVKEGISGSEVVSLFKRTKGRELEMFEEKDYKKLNILMEECTKRNSYESIGVYDEKGELNAAAFFMKYKNRYIFLKSGVTEYGKSNGFMHLLFDSFIRKHSGSDAILDFGGSSVKSVARFYKNFGAKDSVYLQVKKSRLPKLVNWIKSLKK